jgi:hypothetical protein
MGLEPTISTGERPHTYAVERAATEIGNYDIKNKYFKGTPVAAKILRVF